MKNTIPKDLKNYYVECFNDDEKQTACDYFRTQWLTPIIYDFPDNKGYYVFNSDCLKENWIELIDMFLDNNRQ